MIWKVKYKKIYGPSGRYSYDETKFYYDEKSMLRDLKKLPADVNGTVQVYENTATFGIAEHLDSLKREVQLASILEVDSEKSDLHSKFANLYEKGKQSEHPLANTAMKEWEYLAKNDAAAVKKYFAKHRQLFLNYCLDTEEWYDTLLRIYSYADISDISAMNTRWDESERRYKSVPIIVKALDEKRKASYHAAKSKIKKELAAAKKKAKKK